MEEAFTEEASQEEASQEVAAPSMMAGDGLLGDVWCSTGWSSGLARRQSVGVVDVMTVASEGGLESGFPSHVPVAPSGGGIEPSACRSLLWAG